MSDQNKTSSNEPKPGDADHPGMMGDGTEEQNLDQPGNPEARITQEEVDEAFKDDKGKAKDVR